jgi:ATP-binding cassette subfamily B protein
MRYELTARENIAAGRIQELTNTELLLDAAEKSRAGAVIERLPLAYDQMLGRRFEGGVDLSGGEWQKIALARAYLRDAQLLILDEPTAALDARSEFEVFRRFTDLTAGKTALFISHRFSTVRMADRIVVLQGGAVAEQGSHQELMSRGGLYAEMFEMQAASYRCEPVNNVASQWSGVFTSTDHDAAPGDAATARAAGTLRGLPVKYPTISHGRRVRDLHRYSKSGPQKPA